MKEIERKFLLKDNTSFKNDPTSRLVEECLIRQLYLYRDENTIVRLRTVVYTEDSHLDHLSGGYLCFKSKNESNNVLSRNEDELYIPEDTVKRMFEKYFKHKTILIKRRFSLYRNPESKDRLYRKWEVDEFLNTKEPLFLAEAELRSEDELLDIPSWCGVEVTNDPTYQNDYIAKNLLESS